MSSYKTTAEQIIEIEEKRKKLTRQLQELKRKEEQRHAVIYRRIGKIIVDDFSDSTVDEVPDYDEGAQQFVARLLADVATRNNQKNIEETMREYIDSHDFGRLCTGEDGGNYAEHFAFADLLVREGDDGQYRSIDLPAEISRCF